MAAFSSLLDILAEVPDPRRAEGKLYPGFLSAPRRRVTPVEGGSTQIVVDRSGS